MIVGGAAFALEYANRHLTRDLDTSTAIRGALLEAVERARSAIQDEDDPDEPPVGSGVVDLGALEIGLGGSRPDRGAPVGGGDHGALVLGAHRFPSAI